MSCFEVETYKDMTVTYMHGGTCMEVHAWRHMHGGACMKVHAWRCMYNLVPIASLRDSEIQLFIVNIHAVFLVRAGVIIAAGQVISVAEAAQLTTAACLC